MKLYFLKCIFQENSFENEFKKILKNNFTKKKTLEKKIYRKFLKFFFKKLKRNFKEEFLKKIEKIIEKRLKETWNSAKIQPLDFEKKMVAQLQNMFCKILMNARAITSVMLLC